MNEFVSFLVKGCLDRQWANLIASDLDAWRNAFSTGPFTSLVDEHYRMFVTEAQKVPVFMAWNPRMFERSESLISVALQSQTITQEFFHHNNVKKPKPGVREVYETIERVELAVYVVSPRVETVMFLHAFVRRALLTYVDQTLKSGLERCMITDAADIVAPPELVSEGIPAMYGRRLRLETEAVDSAGPIGEPVVGAATKGVLVHDETDYIDALVDRTSRTETPVDGTFGRVKARP